MASAPAQLPPPLAAYVRRFIVRRRRVVILRSAGLALACGLVWMMAACLFDRILRLSAGARFSMLLADVLILLAIMLLPLVRLLRRSADWRLTSADIEQTLPGFGQRLQTVISQTLERPEYRGSAALLHEVAGEVAHQIEGEHASRTLSWRLAFPPWAAAGAAVLLLGLLLPMPRLGMPRLLLRFASPLAAVGPVTTTQIDLRPGDQRVKQGESITIEATAQRLADSQLDLYTSHDGATWARSPMTPAGLDAFAFTLTGLDRDLFYKAAGGDAVSPTYRIAVLRRPQVAEFRIQYTFPAYTNQPRVEVTSSSGVVEALVGTDATLTIVSTEPLASARLKLPSGELPTSATADANVRQASFRIEKDLPLKLEMTSTGGLNGAGPSGMLIRALPDRPPLVRLLQPDTDLRLHPRDVLPVDYQALDDYGVAQAELSTQVNGSTPKPSPIQLHGDARRQEGQLKLDLATLNVQVGDVVSLSLTAKDAAGHTVRSDPLRQVLIAPRSIDINTRLRIAELKQAEQLAAAMLDALQQAQKASSARNTPGAAETDRLVELIQINRSLATASEAGMLLHQSLLRATGRTESADLATALAAWIDRTRLQVWAAERLTAAFADSPIADAASANRLLNAVEQAKQLLAQLRAASAGEQAATILAEKNNLRTPPPTQPADRSASERRRQALQRAQQELDWSILELKLDPKAGDIDARLTQLAADGTKLVRAIRPMDFQPPAADWAAALRQPPEEVPNLPDRLVSAAVAEALRFDTDPIRTHDLQLAGRAAENTAGMSRAMPAREERLSQFPATLAALQREHELTRHPADVRVPQETKQVRAEAADARAKMTAWAAENAADTMLAGGAATQPLAPTTREKAIEDAENRAIAASADTARHAYDKAQENDQAMAERLAAAGELPSPADRQRLDHTMNAAEIIDQLGQEQGSIHQRTATAAAANDPAAAGELEQRQGELAGALAHMDDENRWPDGRRPANTPDSREAAIGALGQAQEQLAALPQQLTTAQEAADAWRQAAVRADQAQRDAAAAPPDRRDAARRAADQANAAATEARDRAVQASRPLDPGSATQLARQLRQFEPESTGAAAGIERQLAPALQQMQQSLSGADSAAVARSAAAVRQALEQAQAQLRDAQGQVMEKDPLLAARWFAQAARRALAERPPDYGKAQLHQDSATQALSRAWENSVRQAAVERLAMSPGFAPLLRSPATQPLLAQPAIVGRIPGLRQWGFLPQHSPESLSAPMRESDPPAYQDALRVYFEALGKTPTEKPKR